MNIQQVAVIGCGTMGRGIAHVTAAAGYDTVMYDVEERALEHAREAIAATLERGIERGKVSREHADATLGRIRLVDELEPATRSASLIIEAVPESLDLKREIFSQIDVFCPIDSIIATNTSSLSITELAQSVERRDKFIGLHFFNPVPIMRLVEIVVGERTSDETVADAREFVQKLGKEEIIVRDVAGFATSRLGLAIGLEAIRMLEDGVASAADIDKAMELGYNHPMGPLRLTDLIGLDVRLAIADYLATMLGPRFEAPQLLRKMVEEGKLGKKTGQGFYVWDRH